MNLLRMVLIGMTATLLACAPKIYLNDRHTVMEDEAAGEWPDFSKGVLEKAKDSAPTAFKKTEINSSKKRLYNVLNGELVSQKAASSAKSPQ